MNGIRWGKVQIIAWDSVCDYRLLKMPKNFAKTAKKILSVYLKLRREPHNKPKYFLESYCLRKYVLCCCLLLSISLLVFRFLSSTLYISGILSSGTKECHLQPIEGKG